MRRIYLTVDTECHNITQINQYIYGNKGDDAFGIPQILEVAKELDIPVNFFLDVCECMRYGNQYIEDIVNLIHRYDQPIWFHFHPNYVSGDDNKSFLWQYSEDEQRNLLKEGIKIYQKYCGKQDRLVFRAGRYGVNPTTYKILKEFGVEVLDLSYFSHSAKMCHLPTEELKTLNVPVRYEGVTLLPNTTYIGFDYFKKFHAFILNVAMTPYNEFRRFIKQTKLNDVVYTMHSWDFIRKWFFAKEYIQGDKYVIRRFRKCVNVARSQGFVFSSLSDFEFKENAPDELINLCKGASGSIMGLFNNFNRFFGIGRLTPKYFIATRGLLVFLLALLVVVLLVVI